MSEDRHPEWDEPTHDLVDFMQQVLVELQSEYSRIRGRTLEDPGTAGDEGEENWADLLRAWLPATFHVVTKGRILTARGEASPQIDVLVLHPDYPAKLRSKKHYMSSGVIAAFECKNTLRRSGISQAVKNSKLIAEILHRERNTKGYWRQPILPDLVYPELHKPLLYGLLAHSHEWETGSAIDTISASITDLDQEISEHPREVIDLVCVADVAVWSAGRCATHLAFDNGVLQMLETCTSTFSCLHAGMWKEDTVYYKSFNTIGALLSRIYEKLSKMDEKFLMFSNYFSLAIKDSQSGGDTFKVWGDVLSPEARKSINPTEMMRCYW